MGGDRATVEDRETETEGIGRDRHSNTETQTERQREQKNETMYHLAGKQMSLKLLTK